jgi:hypothetical protein
MIKEQAGRLSNLLFFWIFRMTLRGKILAVVIAVFVVLTGVLFFISRTVLLDGYKALEQQGMKQHITRVRLGIKNEGEVLNTTVFDWAAGDDAYAFVAGQNPTFVFGKGFDWKNDLVIDLPRDLTGHLTEQGLLNLPTVESAVMKPN